MTDCSQIMPKLENMKAASVCVCVCVHLDTHAHTYTGKEEEKNLIVYFIRFQAEMFSCAFWMYLLISSTLTMDCLSAQIKPDS